MSGMYKVCKKCGRSLPATKKYFNENQTSKDGFQSYCRSCQQKQEVADKLTQMRKGKRVKPKKVKHPSIPKFTEIMKQRQNNK